MFIFLVVLEKMAKGKKRKKSVNGNVEGNDEAKKSITLFVFHFEKYSCFFFCLFSFVGAELDLSGGIVTVLFFLTLLFLN